LENRRDLQQEPARQSGFAYAGLPREHQILVFGDEVEFLMVLGKRVGHQVRRRAGERLAPIRRVRDRVGMPLLSRPNQEWSIDFVSDALANGRAIRSLTVLDDFTIAARLPVVTS
jgi:transposase InsO family protein